MNDTKGDITLKDVIYHMERAQAPERFGGLLIAALLVTAYFKKPPFEIELDALNEVREYFPFYLAHSRVPFPQAIAIAREIDRLIDVGVTLRRKGHLQEEAAIS